MPALLYLANIFSPDTVQADKVLLVVSVVFEFRPITISAVLLLTAFKPNAIPLSCFVTELRPIAIPFSLFVVSLADFVLTTDALLPMAIEKVCSVVALFEPRVMVFEA